LPAPTAPARGRRFESGDEGVEAGREPFVAVIKPNVFTKGDQRREAVDWQ
jgi:formaldehyde-activating enzyme involved in methanogenesis